MAQKSANTPHHRLVTSPATHKREIEAYFGDSLLRELSQDELQFLNSLSLFFVAFTNRSGSTFLTGLINQAGLSVPPRAEVFNSDVIIQTSKEHQIPSFTDYFLKLTRGWGADGLAGFKASGQQLFWLAETGLLTQLKSLKIIHCQRLDIVDQAISYHIANQTGQWQSLMASRCEPEQVSYDQAAIENLMQAIIAGTRDIESFVALNQLPLLTIYYDNCVIEPQPCITKIAHFVGRPDICQRAVDPTAIEIKKQGGPVNLAMRERFLNDVSLVDNPER